MVNQHKPMVTIFFGEMGAGKNYHGQQLANDLQLPFLDGDTIATCEMRRKVDGFKLIPKSVLDDYIPLLGKAILRRARESYHGLVVAQALYLNEHREYLQRYLEENGCVVFFYMVRPRSTYHHIRQLLSRPRGLRWLAYWLMNKPFFQRSTHPFMYEVR